MFLSIITHGNRSSRGTVELIVLLAFKTGICLVFIKMIHLFFFKYTLTQVQNVNFVGSAELGSTPQHVHHCLK